MPRRGGTSSNLACPGLITPRVVLRDLPGTDLPALIENRSPDQQTAGANPR